MKKSFKSRPCLLFCEKELENFKDALKKDRLLKAKFEDFLNYGEELLKTPLLSEAYANEVYSQHGNFYVTGAHITDLAETLGFLYLITKDVKYKAALGKALKHYGSFSAWTGPQNKDRKIPWHADLSTTRMLYGFSLAFDFLYDLTDKERKEIASDAFRLGIKPILDDWILPGKRIHALDSMGHNWWAVCIGLCGIGVISFYDYIDKSEEYLNLIIKALKEFVEYDGGVLLNKIPNFDNKGMFYESLRYFNYGVGELLHFYFVLRQFNSQKAEKFLDLEKIAKAFVSMAYFTGKADNPITFVNFGDSFIDESLSVFALKEYYDKTGLKTVMQKNVLLAKYLLLLGAKAKGLKTIYNCKQTDFDVFDFIYNDVLRQNLNENDYPAVKDYIYKDSGYAFIKKSSKKGSTLLAVRSGYTWNHAHDDAGSFVIYDNGAPLFIDSGTVTYSNPLYLSYFSTARAHNGILVNKEGQPNSNSFRGSKFPGKICDFYKNKWLKYLLCDQTGATCRFTDRNYRNFIWLDEDIIVIIDDLHSYANADYTMLLHYSGKGNEEDNCVFIQNEQSCAKVLFYALYDIQISKNEGYIENSKDDNNPKKSEYFEISYKNNNSTNTAQFVSVYLLNNAVNQVKVKEIKQNDAMALEIRKKDVVYKIAYNLEADGRRMHVNSNNVLFGLNTDGYILIIKETPLKKEYFSVYASYLRKNDKSYFESFSKINTSGILK